MDNLLLLKRAAKEMQNRVLACGVAVVTRTSSSVTTGLLLTQCEGVKYESKHTGVAFCANGWRKR